MPSGNYRLNNFFFWPKMNLYCTIFYSLLIQGRKKLEYSILQFCSYGKNNHGNDSFKCDNILFMVDF